MSGMSFPAHHPEVQLYLLDWSGTISNDRDPVYLTNMELLERHGEPRVSLEEWLGGVTNWNASRHLADTQGHDISGLYREYAQIFDEMLRISPAAIYPGAADALGYLSSLGCNVEVISSHPQPNLEREIVSYGLTGLIGQAMGSITNKVPVIQDALDRHGVTASEAVYVGDTMSDIQAARGAGVWAVAVACGYQPRELLLGQQPDGLFHDLAHVVGLTS